MGYMRHHAIIVTSWDDKLIRKAHKVAKEVFAIGQVTSVLPDILNGYRSFMVGPDGSKEGWEDSDAGDSARDIFIDWLETQRYDDGSSALSWVEVQYGDDEKETKICRDSDAKWRGPTVSNPPVTDTTDDGKQGLA